MHVDNVHSHNFVFNQNVFMKSEVMYPTTIVCIPIEDEASHSG